MEKPRVEVSIRMDGKLVKEVACESFVGAFVKGTNGDATDTENCVVGSFTLSTADATLQALDKSKEVLTSEIAKATQGMILGMNRPELKREIHNLVESLFGGK